MNDHLQKRNWLECDCPTIADIACYPYVGYVGLAPEGKVALEPYPNVLTLNESNNYPVTKECRDFSER